MPVDIVASTPLPKTSLPLGKELTDAIKEAVKEIVANSTERPLTSSNNIRLEDQDRHGNWDWLGFISAVSILDELLERFFSQI